MKRFLARRELFDRWKISGPRLVQALPRRLILFSLFAIAGMLGIGLLIRMDLTVSLEGKSRPENWAEIRAGKEGTVARFYFAEGDFVESGAIVGELFNEVEREALIMAERRLAAMEAERDRFVAELELTMARTVSDSEEAAASDTEWLRAASARCEGGAYGGEPSDRGDGDARQAR